MTHCGLGLCWCMLMKAVSAYECFQDVAYTLSVCAQCYSTVYNAKYAFTAVLYISAQESPGWTLWSRRQPYVSGRGWWHDARTDTHIHTLFVRKAMLFRHYLNYIIAQQRSRSEPNVQMSLGLSPALTLPLGVTLWDHNSGGEEEEEGPGWSHS